MHLSAGPVRSGSVRPTTSDAPNLYSSYYDMRTLTLSGGLVMVVAVNVEPVATREAGWSIRSSRTDEHQRTPEEQSTSYLVEVGETIRGEAETAEPGLWW